MAETRRWVVWEEERRVRVRTWERRMAFLGREARVGERRRRRAVRVWRTCIIFFS